MNIIYTYIKSTGDVDLVKTLPFNFTGNLVVEHSLTVPPPIVVNKVIISADKSASSYYIHVSNGYAVDRLFIPTSIMSEKKGNLDKYTYADMIITPSSVSSYMYKIDGNKDVMICSLLK